MTKQFLTPLKVAGAFTVGVAAVVGVLIANEVCGTSEPVGEVYTASYSYCGQYAGSGGTRHCSLWLTGTEKRQNTRVTGLFFNVDSYKVVR